MMPAHYLFVWAYDHENYIPKIHPIGKGMFKKKRREKETESKKERKKDDPKKKRNKQRKKENVKERNKR